jgi:TDG/mug DNA glycosylase family protein
MLPDCLAPGLNLVFCGTAASTRSAQRQAYYAGPGNMFWRTLHEIGLTPTQLVPEAFRSLLGFGIGLTDLVKGKSGMDHVLTKADFDRDALDDRLRRYQPRILCFTGKKAAQVYFQTAALAYGLQADRRLEVTQFFIAPSTSGAANRYWDRSVWQALADLV